MAVLLHRIRHVATIAGLRRLRALDKLLRQRPRIARALLEASDRRRVAFALAEIMDAFAIEPMPHARRMLVRMRLLGDALGIDDDAHEAGALGTLAHDIGKLAVPDSIIFSPEVLSPTDLDLIQMHSSLGHAILFGVPGLRDAATMVLCHHEYFDGTGYHGWAGDELPLCARMFSVVDSYDAMVRHDRPFRDAVDHRRAFDELRELAGTRYDPRVIDALAAIEEPWVAVGESFPDMMIAA